MRIGAIWDRRIPNSLYRVVIPMRALATNGIAVLWDGLSANAFDVDCLSRCDVVLIHRFTDVHVRRLAQRLRRGGVAIWWDNDDAVDAMPPSEISNAQKRRRMAHVGAEVAQMLSLADLVSAPCRALADRFERGGATRVHVIENHIPKSFILQRARRRPEASITIGWTAGLEHRRDLDALRLRGALERLVRDDPRIEIRSIGLDLGLPHRYGRIPKVELDELPRAVHQFDIAIAPLAELPFNRYRSNVKLKEYGAAGVPWLASPTEPYRAMGPQQGGLLVPDTDWYDELRRLAGDHRARRKLGRRAQRWAAGQTIERHWPQWLDAAETARRLRLNQLQVAN